MVSADVLDDPEALVDSLEHWGDKLAEMTTDLHNGEYDDRDEHRGKIMRFAHGLAGSVVHILDAVNIPLTRELRVPTNLDAEDRREIATTITIESSIQSHYNKCTSYRQLFESRSGKRQRALTPTVDAYDPVGSYIGSLVIRGPSAHQFIEPLQRVLANPHELHEDAPEFCVNISIQKGPDRGAYAVATQRLLTRHHLKPRGTVVTLYRTFTASPYATAAAAERLGDATQSRELRLDEVPSSLIYLAPERLLPDAPSGVGKIARALFGIAQPVSQTRLAELADVTARTVREHLPALEALGLIRETEAGLRPALPIEDDDDDGYVDPVIPEPLEDSWVDTQQLMWELVVELLPPDRIDWLDESHPVGRQFFGPQFNPRTIREHFPEAARWLRVAQVLGGEGDAWRSQSEVAMGPPVEQASLQTAVG